MITVHHLDNSRSQRILWLLEELGTPYKVQHHKRNPKTMLAPASLKAVHPLGRAPVIVDDSFNPPRTLSESGAIIEMLVEKYGPQLKPKKGTEDAFQYLFWMHFAEGSGMPALVLDLVFSRIENPPLPLMVKPFVLPAARAIGWQVRKLLITPAMEANRAFMEKTLSNSSWFAGDSFSAADIQMSFVVEAMAARGWLKTDFPKLQKFLDRIHSREAYKKALSVGGPYKLMS